MRIKVKYMYLIEPNINIRLLNRKSGVQCASKYRL